MSGVGASYSQFIAHELTRFAQIGVNLEFVALLALVAFGNLGTCRFDG